MISSAQYPYRIISWRKSKCSCQVISTPGQPLCHSEYIYGYIHIVDRLVRGNRTFPVSPPHTPVPIYSRGGNSRFQQYILTPERDSLGSNNPVATEAAAPAASPSSVASRTLYRSTDRPTGLGDYYLNGYWYDSAYLAVVHHASTLRLSPRFHPAMYTPLEYIPGCFSARCTKLRYHTAGS